MDEWTNTPPQWSSHDKAIKSILLSSKNDFSPIDDVKLQEIIDESAKFPIRFPIESVRCHKLKDAVSEDKLEEYINSTYPVIHEKALLLCAKFLSHQIKFGNNSFYRDMSLLGLVERLLSKRAVSFLYSDDSFVLLDGSRGSSNWETIGTPEEKPPLLLENCLSYDEIRLSALLSVSSHTYFINNGSRTNRGIPSRDNVEEDGVIIGLIGTRLEKEKVMEYREIMKTKEQNNHQYGYGNFFVPTLQSVFSNFYGDVSTTYDQRIEELKTNKDRFVDLGKGEYFDKLVYERRISLSIDTLLIEANDRAKRENTKAFVHVVGLGLGVWKLWSGQNALFMKAFASRLESLANLLTNVSDVRFAYIHEQSAGNYKHGDNIAHIQIHIEDSNPQDKLEGDFEGKLLVVSYAWDGNALPGNEFWIGSLAGSGDPAAACSTQIAELHNPHINRKVTARNLKIATLNGLLTFEEYQKLHEDD